MMALVACEVSSGLRDSEATVSIREVGGDQQFLRIERDFLTPGESGHYLSVGLIQVDRSGRYALIELPHEADSGASRLWVSIKDVKTPQPTEIVA